jgi:hypothetical protein
MDGYILSSWYYRLKSVLVYCLPPILDAYCKAAGLTGKNSVVSQTLIEDYLYSVQAVRIPSTPGREPAWETTPDPFPLPDMMRLAGWRKRIVESRFANFLKGDVNDPVDSNMVDMMDWHSTTGQLDPNMIADARKEAEEQIQRLESMITSHLSEVSSF